LERLRQRAALFTSWQNPKKVRLLEFDLATGAVTKNAKVDE